MTRLAQHFVFDCYTKTVFYGIIPDTGIEKALTAGKNQFKALQHEISKIELDITNANKDIICFRSKMFFNSISIVKLFTLISTANFYIIDRLTPFFFCLNNIDTLDIYLNNIINKLICQNGKSVPIICKCEHLWFFVN